MSFAGYDRWKQTDEAGDEAAAQVLNACVMCRVYICEPGVNCMCRCHHSTEWTSDPLWHGWDYVWVPEEGAAS